MVEQYTWIIEDHLCRSCGGRILRAATECGEPWTGDPLYRCSHCGASVTGLDPHELCWCAYSHRHGGGGAKFSCLPEAVLETRPDLAGRFHSTEGEIGVLLGEDPLEEIKERAA